MSWAGTLSLMGILSLLTTFAWRGKKEKQVHKLVFTFQFPSHIVCMTVFPIRKNYSLQEKYQNLEEKQVIACSIRYIQIKLL